MDDHAFLVEGLKARIAIEDDIEIVGHLDGAQDLIRETRRLGVDIVLLDIEMPNHDAFAAIEDLRRHCPDVRTVLLSAFVRDHYIDAAYRAGAWGYLSKSDPPDAVIEGLRSVAGGKTTFSPEVIKRTQTGRETSLLASLTPREEQILRLIAKGGSRTDIAEQICRSPMTVDNHRKSIMKKLGIHDRGELVRFAISEGLVEV